MKSAQQTKHVLVRELGLTPYTSTLNSMREFTQSRDASTIDEIWFLEHEPVFTQGQAGKPEHILAPGDIPVVQSCRGGQVTYHGPGQLTGYFLINLTHKNLGVRQLVTKLEQVIIDLLAFYELKGHLKDKAPGVYINDEKICSIGLRVKKGCCYHGISFNVNMDLSPFSRINPCGYSQLKMTQLAHYIPNIELSHVQEALRNLLLPALGYDTRFVFSKEESQA